MIDHLVFATPDIDGAVEWVAGRVGVQPTPGGRHPGLGTCNALLDLGAGAYLEIIGVDPRAAGAPDGPRPFGLDRITEPRLATWAAKVDGIDERVARARAAGYTRLAHLEGGMRAWEAAGHPLLQNPAHAAGGAAGH